MLMMEIATSAVRDDDVVILSNLFVRFARDAKGTVYKYHRAPNDKLTKGNLQLIQVWLSFQKRKL